MAGDPFFFIFLPLSACALFFGAPLAALIGVQTFYAQDIFEVSDTLLATASTGWPLRRIRILFMRHFRRCAQFDRCGALIEC